MTYFVFHRGQIIIKAGKTDFNYKEDIMKSTGCVPEKFSKYMLGLLALGAAFALIVIGVTILPFVGFILAVPVTLLAIYIFRLHLNDQCEIDLST